VEESGAQLRSAFSAAEAARGVWQQRQDGSTRNFRNELDAHLQQMEELLTEKVRARKIEDAARRKKSEVLRAKSDDYDYD
jgi:hypothetical protein